MVGDMVGEEVGEMVGDMVGESVMPGQRPVTGAPECQRHLVVKPVSLAPPSVPLASTSTQALGRFSPSQPESKQLVPGPKKLQELAPVPSLEESVRRHWVSDWEGNQSRSVSDVRSGREPRSWLL